MLRVHEKELKSLRKKSQKVQKKIRKETKKAIRDETRDKAALLPTGDRYKDMYITFREFGFSELEELIIQSSTREERAFYRALLNLKLQIEQEKIIGEVLL